MYNGCGNDGKESDLSKDATEWIRITKFHLYLDGVTKDTIWNWANKGCLSHVTKKRVYLKTRQRGGAVETCMEYYQKFLNELNGED